MSQSPEVQVGVVWRADRGCYYLRWRDPKLDTYKHEHTEIGSKRSRTKAIKLAEEKSIHLSSRWNPSNDGMSWQCFRERHLAEVVAEVDYEPTQVQQRGQLEDFADRMLIGELMRDDIDVTFMMDVDAEFEKRLQPGRHRCGDGRSHRSRRVGLSMGLKSDQPPQLLAIAESKDAEEAVRRQLCRQRCQAMEERLREIGFAPGTSYWAVALLIARVSDGWRPLVRTLDKLA
ncbi:MAG: hypothetical protein AAFU85_30790, partial [Planctomycetota bacterium]